MIHRDVFALKSPTFLSVFGSTEVPLCGRFRVTPQDSRFALHFVIRQMLLDLTRDCFLHPYTVTNVQAMLALGNAMFWE